MENLKIQVNNEAESKEAQELFFELGGVWASCGKTYNDMIQIGDYIFFTDCNMLNYGLGLGREEITTQQLRDLVVLKRNDVDDATHENAMYPYIKLSDGWYYFDDESGKWMKSTGGKPEYYEKLKPIEKEMKMKEYLNPEQGYALVKCFVGETPTPESWIEVPDGAVAATLCNDYLIFWNKHGFGFSERDGDIGFVSGDDDMLFKEYMETYNDISIVWQRSETENTVQSAWDKQTGVDHYKKLAIQPMEYALKNKLDYAQANVVKYVTRHANKNGKEDLLKAIHNIELMIEHYYGNS